MYSTKPSHFLRKNREEKDVFFLLFLLFLLFFLSLNPAWPESSHQSSSVWLEFDTLQVDKIKTDGTSWDLSPSSLPDPYFQVEVLENILLKTIPQSNQTQVHLKPLKTKVDLNDLSQVAWKKRNWLKTGVTLRFSVWDFDGQNQSELMGELFYHLNFKEIQDQRLISLSGGSVHLTFRVSYLNTLKMTPSKAIKTLIKPTPTQHDRSPSSKSPALKVLKGESGLKKNKVKSNKSTPIKELRVKTNSFPKTPKITSKQPAQTKAIKVHSDPLPKTSQMKVDQRSQSKTLKMKSSTATKKSKVKTERLTSPKNLKVKTKVPLKQPKVKSRKPPHSSPPKSTKEKPAD